MQKDAKRRSFLTKKYKKCKFLLIFTLIFRLKTNKSYKITLFTITNHPIFQKIPQKPLISTYFPTFFLFFSPVFLSSVFCRPSIYPPSPVCPDFNVPGYFRRDEIVRRCDIGLSLYEKNSGEIAQDNRYLYIWREPPAQWCGLKNPAELIHRGCRSAGPTSNAPKYFLTQPQSPIVLSHVICDLVMLIPARSGKEVLPDAGSCRTKHLALASNYT